MKTDMTVANEILAQLGGRRFIAMTGAKNLLGSGDSLTMKIGRNAKRVSHVRVTLNWTDLYDIEFLKASLKSGCETLAKVDGVYAEELQATFTANTGLYTRL